MPVILEVAASILANAAESVCTELEFGDRVSDRQIKELRRAINLLEDTLTRHEDGELAVDDAHTPKNEIDAFLDPDPWTMGYSDRRMYP